MAVEVQLGEGFGKWLVALARLLFKTPQNITITALCAIIAVLLLRIHFSDHLATMERQQIRDAAAKREEKLESEKRYWQQQYVDLSKEPSRLWDRVHNLTDSLNRCLYRGTLHDAPLNNSTGQ